MDLDLRSPELTRRSLRAKRLEVRLPAAGEGAAIHLVIDGSGLQIIGHGPWATAQHGERRAREWRELPAGVDQNGVIVAETLTGRSTDDASVVPDLVGRLLDDKNMMRSTADGA